jgi:hypothetical protein
LSGTIIRGTQIVMENHLASPFKEKDQQKRDGLNSTLLGLRQDIWANQLISPLHPRPHSEGSRNTSNSPEASVLGSRTQADPRQHHRLARALDTTLSVSDSPETGLWRRSPIGALKTPVTSPTFSRLPNRTSREWPGSNHHAIDCNKHGEELLTTIPPILALYARFVPVQCTEQLPWATIPTIRIRSHRTSRHRGLDPLRQSNYKDKYARVLQQEKIRYRYRNVTF